MTEQKNNEIQNETENQEIFKQKLKEETMAKLAKAVELNKKNSLSKEAREAKAEACALILMAMRAEIQLDPNDPLFQIFVQKQSWRDAMKRACKEVCNPEADLFRKTLALLDAIGVSAGISLNIGGFIRGITNFFSKHGVNPLDEAEVTNNDNWNDFYEEIPKDGGNGGKGPSLQHNSNTMEMAQLNKKAHNRNIQRFLSTRSTGKPTRKKITNQDFYKYFIKEMMALHKKTAKSGLKRAIGNQQLATLSQKRTIHVA